MANLLMNVNIKVIKHGVYKNIGCNIGKKYKKLLAFFYFE